MIRILVAEDHVVTRVGITTIVDMQPDMKVVGQASNGRQAVELFGKHLPDVTLVDMRMPILSGVEATLAIRKEFPDARIIALTSYSGENDIRSALKAGVQAYLTKDLMQDDLLTAIREVYHGKTYVAPALEASLRGQEDRPDLSPRELQVLELIVRGLVNKQIAWSLDLAEYTVKNYVKKILKKLEVHDRTQAATVAIRRGIIHL